MHRPYAALRRSHPQSRRRAQLTAARWDLAFPLLEQTSARLIDQKTDAMHPERGGTTGPTAFPTLKNVDPKERLYFGPSSSSTISAYVSDLNGGVQCITVRTKPGPQSPSNRACVLRASQAVGSVQSVTHLSFLEANDYRARDPTPYGCDFEFLRKLFRALNRLDELPFRPHAAETGVDTDSELDEDEQSESLRARTRRAYPPYYRDLPFFDTSSGRLRSFPSNTREIRACLHSSARGPAVHVHPITGGRLPQDTEHCACAAFELAAPDRSISTLSAPSASLSWDGPNGHNAPGSPHSCNLASTAAAVVSAADAASSAASLAGSLAGLFAGPFSGSARLGAARMKWEHCTGAEILSELRIWLPSDLLKIVLYEFFPAPSFSGHYTLTPVVKVPAADRLGSARVVPQPAPFALEAGATLAQLRLAVVYRTLADSLRSEDAGSCRAALSSVLAPSTRHDISHDGYCASGAFDGSDTLPLRASLWLAADDFLFMVGNGLLARSEEGRLCAMTAHLCASHHTGLPIRLYR